MGQGQRAAVIVTRGNRAPLVPLLFYCPNDAYAPRWRSRPRSAGSDTNTGMLGEPLLPESRLAEEPSGANAQKNREGCLSSAVTQGTEHRNLWLRPARSSFPTFFLFFLPVHSPVSSPMAEVGGTRLSLGGTEPPALCPVTRRWVSGEMPPLR